MNLIDIASFPDASRALVVAGSDFHRGHAEPGAQGCDQGDSHSPLIRLFQITALGFYQTLSIGECKNGGIGLP
jgi:hypothetical protein